MLTLSGKAALVTGGSRGIGRAICVLFARLGARVVVNYHRDQTAALGTVAAVQAIGGEAHAIPADISQPAEAGHLVAEAESRLGGLDILVVNHGIWKRASIEAMTAEQWEETVRVNLGGAYGVCHHAARVMIPAPAPGPP